MLVLLSLESWFRLEFRAPMIKSLEQAVDLAAQYDRNIVVEEAVDAGKLSAQLLVTMNRRLACRANM